MMTLEADKEVTTPQSPEEIQNAIVAEFEAYPEWDGRYSHIIKLGKQLPDFPEEARVETNLVKGCQSQVWMTATLTQDGRVALKADSDAMIVQGLVALMLRLYNNQTPATILATDPDFLERIEMSKHISMQRSNGLFAMIKQIKLFATVFQLQAG